MRLPISLCLLSFILFCEAASTQRPNASPTRPPTTKPTLKPSLSHLPTRRPTVKPSTKPTPFPSSHPTFRPTSTPTSIPSSIPTSFPTSIPTSYPTGAPTSMPTFDFYFKEDHHSLTAIEYLGISFIIFLSSALAVVIIYLYIKNRQKLQNSEDAKFSVLGEGEGEEAGELEMVKKPEFLIPLMLLGDSAVGKTCILKRFLDDQFDRNTIPNIGVVPPRYRSVDLGTIGTGKLALYDTPGNPRFRQIMQEKIRDAAGFLIVFDVSDNVSFSNVNAWFRAIDLFCIEPSPVKILVGNKVDDSAPPRAISYEQARKLARDNRAAYIETSATSGQGIEEAYLCIARRLLMKSFASPHLDPSSPTLESSSLKPSSSSSSLASSKSFPSSSSKEDIFSGSNNPLLLGESK